MISIVSFKKLQGEQSYGSFLRHSSKPHLSQNEGTAASYTKSNTFHNISDVQLFLCKRRTKNIQLCCILFLCISWQLYCRFDCVLYDNLLLVDKCNEQVLLRLCSPFIGVNRVIEGSRGWQNKGNGQVGKVLGEGGSRWSHNTICLQGREPIEHCYIQDGHV